MHGGEDESLQHQGQSSSSTASWTPAMPIRGRYWLLGRRPVDLDCSVCIGASMCCTALQQAVMQEAARPLQSLPKSAPQNSKIPLCLLMD
jgi:hypothetical protein